MARENWEKLFAQNNQKKVSNNFDNDEWTWEDNKDNINTTNEIKSDIIIYFQKQGIIVDGSTLTFANDLTIKLTNDQIESLNDQYIRNYK